MLKSNPGHIGGRQVLSPLGQCCHQWISLWISWGIGKFIILTDAIVMQWCCSSRKIQCDWLDSQNQNKRLNNRYCELSLRTKEAATIPIDNTLTVVVLAFCFGFEYRANHIVSYESCYRTPCHVVSCKRFVPCPFDPSSFKRIQILWRRRGKFNHWFLFVYQSYNAIGLNNYWMGESG